MNKLYCRYFFALLSIGWVSTFSLEQLISFSQPYFFGESGHDNGFLHQVIFGTDFVINSDISLGLAYKCFEVSPMQTWANNTHNHDDPRLHNYDFDVKYNY